MIKLQPLTLTFEPLLGEPPQQSATVFTEGRTLVVVDFKPVRHVDLEALLVDLKHTSHIIQLIIKARLKVKVKIVCFDVGCRVLETVNYWLADIIRLHIYLYWRL